MSKFTFATGFTNARLDYPVIHPAKIQPIEYQEVKDGNLRFVIRKGDVDYQVGHQIELKEFNDVYETYTGRSMFKQITYVMVGPFGGLGEGWVILSIV